MKIVRTNEVPEEGKGEYTIKRLFTEPLKHNPENIGFYLTTVPPRRKAKRHSHPIALEIIFFLTNGVVQDDESAYSFSANDIAILQPGERHEIQAGDEEVRLIAVRIPNFVADKEICD
jgi:quercetin dioxygenase-like cupin family protein